MMEENKKRIFYYDELRVFAILFVILCHVCQCFPAVSFKISPTLLSYISIGRMGVPLFFMLSGALLLNRDYSIGSFIKKRFPRILIPAFFWLIVVMVISLSYANFNYDKLIYLISHASFPWFVYAILGIYLLIPILNSFIKEFGTKGAKYIILIWIFLIIAYNFNYSNDGFNLIFDNFGIYTGFPVLGYYLANKNFRIYSLPMIIICSIILISCIITNIYISWTYKHIIFYYSIILIIETSAFFLILRYISKYCEYNKNKAYSKFHYKLINSSAGTLIYIISSSSYTIYLMLHLVTTFVIDALNINKFYMIPEAFLVVSILCILIVLVLARIPIINKLSGVHY